MGLLIRLRYRDLMRPRSFRCLVINQNAFRNVDHLFLNQGHSISRHIEVLHARHAVEGYAINISNFIGGGTKVVRQSEIVSNRAEPRGKGKIPAPDLFSVDINLNWNMFWKANSTGGYKIGQRFDQTEPAWSNKIESSPLWSPGVIVRTFFRHSKAPFP